MGPQASQVAPKQLGTNGGGYNGVNSAHPHENPTPLANMLEMLALLLIPAGLCFTFGRQIKDMAVQKPPNRLLYCQPQPCSTKKADTRERVGLCQMA